MSSAAETDGRALKGAATRDRIIEAAREVLVTHGHAGTSTRAVAEEAGVNLSQVHYHFGGRQGLLIEVLHRENEALLARQNALFSGSDGTSRHWPVTTPCTPSPERTTSAAGTATTSCTPGAVPTTVRGVKVVRFRATSLAAVALVVTVGLPATTPASSPFTKPVMAAVNVGLAEP